VVCVLGVIVFSLVHSSLSILIVLAWWGVDLFVRYVIMAHYRYPRTASIELLLPDLVEVRFPKPANFHFNAGQFVQVCIPEISSLEFHPITVSSAPHEADVTLHIRALGNWTRKLAAFAEKNTQATIMLEGPYGSLTMDLDNDDCYQMILCISGGIGVTPCRGVAKSILHQHTQQGRKLQKLHFVWVVRDFNMAVALPPPLLPSGEEGASKVDSNILRTDVYVTKSLQLKDEEQNLDTDAAPCHVLQGRPDFDSLFQDLKKEATQHECNSVAVIGCGPMPMMERIRAACRNHSDSDLKCGEGVHFHLHEEIFEF
jgi:NAD(P)H-flavin reductase